ncbi:FxSxx-COOH system tetratricopeptide repeat protein [Candidatus Leptofilum sp.]|uniref:FxSxx-COOH system tetratricopeptide repeat protein n=1 Tax=Candidatus Leptofilum sp. TaxID=3241576 RepID=UPI003B596A35
MSKRSEPPQYKIDADIIIGNIGDGDFHNEGTINIGLPSFSFPINNLPPPNPRFTGRQQHLELLQTTAVKHRSMNGFAQAITGLGGIGKTQLALAYAYRHRQTYDIIWWINGSDATQVESDLLLLGQRLLLPLPANDFPAARQIVLSWLSSTDKNWLLIYDNVDTLNARQLRPYQPSGAGHILITSRNPHWAKQAWVLDVNVFTSQESTAFFQKRLHGASDPALLPLAEALGYLPLALEHAAAYMETREQTAAFYLKQFKTRRQELWERTEPPDDYHATIATTWDISFKQVQKTPGAAELLALCCFLAPNDIPLFLLSKHSDALRKIEWFAFFLSRKTIRKNLRIVLENSMMRADALSVLRKYSLLNGSEESLNIHQMVQMVYRDRIGREKELEWVELASELLISAFPVDNHDVITRKARRQFLPHLQCLIVAANSLEIADHNLVALNLGAGTLLKDSYEYDAAKPYFERGLAISEKVLGTDHPHTNICLIALGKLLMANGEFDMARPYFERALTFFEKAMGGDHPNTATSLNILGSLLLETGKYEAAKPYYERALAIREEIMGANHPETASSLRSLGSYFMNIGEYEAARPYYERALAIRKEIMGANHPETASSLNSLGVLLFTKGEYEEARKYFERALAIEEEVMGVNHPGTATNLDNLGSLFEKIGDYATARLYFERTLAIREEALGVNHLDTATSLNNLGHLFWTTRDYAASKPYFERAHAIYHKVLGADHPDTATSLNNLGSLFLRTGDYEEAKSNLERAHAIYHKVLGADHPETALCLNNLGALFRKTGESRTAGLYLERALAIFEKALGADHPNTALPLNNLGLLFLKTGDYREARSYLERALAITEKAHGVEHLSTTHCLEGLGKLLKATGEVEAARPYLERALAITEKVLGIDHPDAQIIKGSLNSLADI